MPKQALAAIWSARAVVADTARRTLAIMGIWGRQTRSFLGLIGLVSLVGSAIVLGSDPRARVLASNTLMLATTVAIASVLLAAPLAFLLFRTDVPGQKLSRVALLALLFTPLYLQAAAWQAGFGLQGWVTMAAHMPALLDGWRGAIAIHVFAAIPWAVVIVGLGLRMAEPELEEEALLDATPCQVFRRVTLRRALESISAAVLWIAITTAGEMTVTDLFQLRTYAEEIYTEFALGDEMGAAPWKLLPSIVATGWVVIGGLLLSNWLIASDRFGSQRRSHVFRLGRWRVFAGCFTAIAIGWLVGVPVCNLVTKAGTLVTRRESGFSRSWSGWQCWDMVAQSPLRFSHEFGWSLLIALAAATVAIGIGLPLAWSARRSGWRALPAWIAIALSLALPGPLIGLGLIACFNAAQWPWLVRLYDHSIVAVCLAQAIRALPLCTLVLWYSLRTIPAELLQSATLEGAGPWSRLFRIALPERWPSVAAAWLVALAVAWGELSASILVAPPGVTTLPVRVFGLIHYGVDDQVAGVSLASLALFFGLALALTALARRADRQN